MKIHSDFEGGNARVLRVDGDTVFLQNELRDSLTDWFFWSFCVEGAEGCTLHFVFDKNWVGPYGAAVSRDYEHWHWSETAVSPCSFTYTFAEDESKVYFAHDLVYYLTNFNTFLSETGISPRVLCRSRQGREVPYFCLGTGENVIVLTARHHACESTGSYVLEGFVREYLKSPIENTALLVVPMVDYDGVVCGDQGKNRGPHDHNRDYTSSPIYPETAAIMSLAADKNVCFAIDFHSPNHSRGRNETVFIVRKNDAKKPLFDRFGELFEQNTTAYGMRHACMRHADMTHASMTYAVSNDMMPNTFWNTDTAPTASVFFSDLPSCHLSFTLETTYFGTPDNKVSTEKLIGEGCAVCRALGAYLARLS